MAIAVGCAWLLSPRRLWQRLLATGLCGRGSSTDALDSTAALSWCISGSQSAASQGWRALATQCGS
jgi:hypothetical protein